ncbi:hypothetical protein Ancab_040462 [Ancistrocladus abbreviatus]
MAEFVVLNARVGGVGTVAEHFRTPILNRSPFFGILELVSGLWSLSFSLMTESQSTFLPSSSLITTRSPPASEIAADMLQSINQMEVDIASSTPNMASNENDIVQGEEVEEVSWIVF